MTSVDNDKSARSSKVGIKKGSSNHTHSIMINQREDEKEQFSSIYSFDNSDIQKKELKRTSFNETLGRKMMTNEMFFRESLHLTEIREN